MNPATVGVHLWKLQPCGGANFQDNFCIKQTKKSNMNKKESAYLVGNIMCFKHVLPSKVDAIRN